MATRGKDKKLDILPESPGDEHLQISGAKLPSYKQILLCYLSKLKQLRNEDLSKNTKLSTTAGKHVACQIIHHYENAHIPTMLEKNMIQYIIKFHDVEYQKCFKIPISRRNNNPTIEAFKEKLDKTMPLWPRNVFAIMNDWKKSKSDEEKKKIDDDILFLENMMNERTFVYSSFDSVFTKTLLKRVKKKENAFALCEKEKKRKIKSVSIPHYEPDSTENNDEEEVTYSNDSANEQRKDEQGSDHEQCKEV